MAGFVVKKIDLDNLNVDTGTFTHEPTGIELTLKSFNDPMFTKAHELIQTRSQLDMKELKERALDSSFFDNIKSDGKSTNELQLEAIGKFLVVDWNAVDENGDKLPVSAENFVLLTANIPMNQQAEFVEWCFSMAVDVAIKHVEKLSETKKKSSRATSGKRATQK